MDPIGLAFEHFDAMGRYRATEWDKPIDASGAIYQRADDDTWMIESEFDGVVELGQALADSEQVKQCLARQWFRFALGRSESQLDSCSLQHIDERFATANTDVRELLIAIAQTPAFRFVRTTQGDGQ
jgi:hypothetical protein